MTKIKRIALIVLLLPIYFFAIRPIRAAIIEYWIYPETTSIVISKKDFRITKIRSVTIRIDKKDKNKKYGEITSFKVPFGVYFIFSLIIIVGLDIRWRWMLGISTYHLIIFLIGYGLLIVGLQETYILLKFISLLNSYLLPAFSFGIVAFAWFNEKGKTIDGQNMQPVTEPLYPHK
ncbi:MAG TPA: hypothetical protein VKA34_00755 [Balneolales bacterium]|nr:hypothetical protein [Balneolales bacterium]